MWQKGNASTSAIPVPSAPGRVPLLYEPLLAVARLKEEDHGEKIVIQLIPISLDENRPAFGEVIERHFGYGDHLKIGRVIAPDNLGILLFYKTCILLKFLLYKKCLVKKIGTKNQKTKLIHSTYNLFRK